MTFPADTFSPSNTKATTLVLSSRQLLENTCCHCCQDSECGVNLNGDFVGDFEQDLHTEHQICISSLDNPNENFDHVVNGTEANNQYSIETKITIFHNSFYLSIIGPLDILSNKKGIKGWSYYTKKYVVVLAWPPHLKKFHF